MKELTKELYNQLKEEIRKELEGSYGRDLFRIISKRESNICKAFCIANGCDPDDIGGDKTFKQCPSITCKKFNKFIDEIKKFHSVTPRVHLENKELIDYLQ